MQGNRKRAAQVAALAIGFALAGCGGSGGSALVSTPPPASYTKISEMSGDRTFQMAGVQYSSSTLAGLTNGTPQALGSGMTVAYTASTDSYTLTAPDGTSTTFAPLDRAAPIAAAPDTQNWTKQTASGQQAFSLTLPTVDGVKLSYTIIGSWVRNSFPMSKDIQLAVGGIPTLASDMPRTGSASYATAVDGSAGSDSLAGNSSATFSADFAKNSVATSMTLVGTAPVPFGGTTTSYGTFNGTGTISSTGPGFAGTLSGNGATGLFSGAFFGPKAAEMAYAWYLSGGNLSAAGTLVGRKQ